MRAPEKYQVEIPVKNQKDVGLYARDFSTASAIKKFTTEYPKYSFIGTTVNAWKNICNDGDCRLSRELEDPTRQTLLCQKYQRHCVGNKNGWGVINRCQLISIATGVARANNPSLLKEYGVIQC